MEDLKDNNKFKQELALPAAKSLFLQFFKGKQLKGFDVMTEENCFFLMEKGENKEFFKNPTISEQNLMEVSSLLDLDSIFSLLFKRNLNKPIEVFIDDITETLLEIHTQIHSRELKITENKSKISIFQASLTEISKALKKSQKAQENFLSINYVKDKSYCNELFKHYKLKYKGGITSDILYSIYAEEDLLNKQCILPIGAGNSDIFINIYGKNTHLKENEFNLISSIKLPLIEVYSSITTEGFLFENIPPVYLILEFKDIRENAVYKGVNRFELRFDLKISLEKREDIIKGLIESYNNENNYCKESIKRRILLVDSLLEPFKEEIYYDIDGGIMNRNKMRKNGVCDINCVIY